MIDFIGGVVTTIGAAVMFKFLYELYQYTKED